MKKILSISLIMALVSLGSCKKYLDTVPDNILTIDDVFKTRTNVIRYIGNIYQAMPNEFNQRFSGFENSGNWTGASDEGKYTWDFNYSTNINKSAWANTDGSISTYWDSYYRAIRNATDFIQRIDGATPEISIGEKTILKGEARALRAFYYYQLLRIYGPVVILGEEVIPVAATPDEVNKPRSTFDECISFVVDQLDKAYTELPVSSAVAGKFTKGVVKAYKVQALMLSASPLFNGNTDYALMKNDDGKHLINQTYDAGKWTKAATAAKEFINEFAPGTYDLFRVSDANPFKAAYLSSRDVIMQSWNKEWIFGRSNSRYDIIRYDRTPFHAGYASQRGAGANGATQAQVDAYFMANGKPITDPTSGYTATGFSSFQAPYDNTTRSTFNQWVNREPRFYVGITYTNSVWLYPDQNTGNLIVTNMEFSGNSGLAQSTSDVTPTGYIIRKGVANTDDARGNLYLRLAQIYLDYAEALNESTPADADILKYLNFIRERAGIPQYGAGVNPLPVPATQAEMRAAIRAERRVELAFENVRYFETRRWKIAEQTDAGPFYGMDRTKNGTAFYTKTLLETRVFRKRDYLFPIPANEVLRNPLIKQNTGW
ncbi:RagB/SusD family nutrient uptake outer membrane protein [Lacibacter sediminis]|uniref:RagB/SusD family nutrient uptake outer membrane protein n=1 Tax=Lacibacter sediminis TaxID=2760713 RepID=A0A7G5XB55_9BACT|nr:RagB/SusD family nutrient uptake outer membrane protein [Lacibacter sediminis]QNA42708.1 RagB/SusD family nutrient uptake outer membrane protein [Lacibacter sediminis]